MGAAESYGRRTPSLKPNTRRIFAEYSLARAQLGGDRASMVKASSAAHLTRAGRDELRGATPGKSHPGAVRARQMQWGCGHLPAFVGRSAHSVRSLSELFNGSGVLFRSTSFAL
jgi:hypothetical protein